MIDLLCAVKAEGVLTLMYFVFWTAMLFLFGWAIFSFLLGIITQVIRHLKTKKKNEEVFKKYGFKPKY